MKLRDDSERLDFYRSCLKEAESMQTNAYENTKKDTHFYVGNHYTDEEIKELNDKGRAPLVINLCKKPVDMAVGNFSQNMGDLKAFPVETAGQSHADILSQAMKWNMVQKGVRSRILQAVKTACISGVGWISLFMEYDDDLESGNIKARWEHPLSILPDPAAKELDLSDAAYMIKRGFYQKGAVIANYLSGDDEGVEAKKRLVANCETKLDPDDSIMKSFGIDDPRKDTDYVMVDEMFYKEYVDVALFTLPDGKKITIETADKKAINMVMEEIPGANLVAKRTIPMIRRIVVVNKDIVIFSGDAPDTTKYYTYIPFFYDFTPEAEQYEDRYQGMIRGLRDVNSEIDKRRELQLEAALQQPLSGFFAEENSIVDVDDFAAQAGPNRLIRYRGVQPTPIKGDFTAMGALNALETQARQDMREIGPNPDLLGTVGGSGPSAPGITVETRQRSALVSMQPAYDNFSVALKQVGRVMIDMMLQNWSDEKFDMVCDDKLPEDFQKARSSSFFDVMVDETANSKTYQLAVFQQVLELVKGLGIPPTPAIIETLIKYSGVPASFSEKIIQEIMAQMQATPPGQGQEQGIQQ